MDARIGRKDGKKEGRKEGRKEGMKEGRKEGRKRHKERQGITALLAATKMAFFKFFITPHPGVGNGDDGSW